MWTPEQESAYQARLEEITRMPPEQQAEEMARLSADYPGRSEDLRAQRDFAETMVDTPMAKGTIAGPSSNPYTAYVAASPLEHAANALRVGKGTRERKDAREKLAKLSTDKEMALQGMMGSLIRNPRQQIEERDEDPMLKYYRRGGA